MYNYCTLFNSDYLSRGLAMYESLKEHSQPFHLYIFAFDDRSETLLKKLNLDHMTVIGLNEFENERLLAVKDDRSAGEYCWTCTPSTIKYCIETYKLDNCTYLDADLYFYSDPSVLIEEMGAKSVLITEHRYTPIYDQSATSGIYCVQFMTFKNTPEGMHVLNWWVDACLDWCYARFEDGKFGDQKYLDDWTERFDCVHVLENLGGGVAPWNVQSFDFFNGDVELVFYHFQALRFLPDGKIDLSGCVLQHEVIENIYKPYVKCLVSISQNLKSYDVYDFNGSAMKKSFHWKQPLRKLKRILNKTYYIYKIEKLLRN